MDPRIDDLQRLAADDPDVLPLGGGFPSHQLFPRAALGRAFLAAMREPTASALQYAWPEGRERLRAFIAARLRLRGAELSPDDVIITSGAQQAIALAARLILGQGDPIATDPETYPAALAVFRSVGGIPTVGAAERLYLMPAIGNPRGVGLSAAMKGRLSAARWIIEDDAYAELRFDGRLDAPLLERDRERVFHVGTFSKTLAPGLRVGWLIPPASLRQQAIELKQANDLESSGLGQAILERFLADDDWDARLARARSHYQKRAERLLAALHRHLPDFRVDVPEGGFALYLESDAEVDDILFLAHATRHGVSFDPGNLFRPAADRRLALRVCFSSLAARQLDEAARRLGRAWQTYRRR